MNAHQAPPFRQRANAGRRPVRRRLFAEEEEEEDVPSRCSALSYFGGNCQLVES